MQKSRPTRGILVKINSFLAFQMDHIVSAHMSKAYVSGNKVHQSHIQSLNNDLLLSWVLGPNEEPNQTDYENSQLKNE